MLKQLLLSLFAFALLISCKKDSGNPPGPEDYLLSAIEFGSIQLSFTYNSKGQIAEMSSRESPNTTNSGRFEYENDKLVKLKLHWTTYDRTFDELYSFRYDNKGNLIEGINETVEYSISFHYNDQGKLAGCFYKNKLDDLEFDEKGNYFQKSKRSQLPDDDMQTGELLFTASYQYDDKPNPFQRNNLGLLFIVMDYENPDYALLLSRNTPVQAIKENLYNYTNPATTSKDILTFNYSSAYDKNNLLSAMVCEYKSESFRDGKPDSPYPGMFRSKSAYKFTYTRKS